MKGETGDLFEGGVKASLKGDFGFAAAAAAGEEATEEAATAAAIEGEMGVGGIELAVIDLGMALEAAVTQLAVTGFRALLAGLRVCCLADLRGRKSELRGRESGLRGRESELRGRESGVRGREAVMEWAATLLRHFLS